jgi:molybdopterin molybdotransferase
VQHAAIQRGLAQADVVITSGGVSMGTRDLIKPILAELGTIHFGRTASKPGKPVTFATIADKLVFGMPGFPVSSLVSFEVYVRPALRRLQGDRQPERPRVRVQMADPIRPPRDRVEYQRAVVGWQAGKLIARSTGIQFSTRLLSLRGANALLIVPVGDGVYEPGTELDALLTGPLHQWSGSGEG